MKDIVFNFFESQKDLVIIDLGIVKAGIQEIKRLVFRILESCPKLEEFRLQTEDPFDLIMDLELSEFPRFLTLISKLKYMNLPFEWSSGPWYSALELNSVTLNLTQLQLDDVNDDLCIAILRRCTSLQDLELGRCVDDTLQTIFQYLVSEIPEKECSGWNRLFFFYRSDFAEERKIMRYRHTCVFFSQNFAF